MLKAAVRELFVVHVSPKGHEGETVVRRWIIDDQDRPVATREFWVYHSVTSARFDKLEGRTIYDRFVLPWKKGATPDPTFAEVWI